MVLSGLRKVDLIRPPMRNHRRRYEDKQRLVDVGGPQHRGECVVDLDRMLVVIYITDFCLATEPLTITYSTSGEPDSVKKWRYSLL